MAPRDFLMTFSFDDFHGYLITKEWVLDLCCLRYYNKINKECVDERIFLDLWDELRSHLHSIIYSPIELDWTQMFDNLIERAINEKTTS